MQAKEWVFGSLGFLLARQSRVVIIANGQDLPQGFQDLIDPSWPIACCDGGANRLRSLGGAHLAPQLIVGDLDSVTSESLAAFSASTEILHRPSQDKNDLEKTLDECEQRWPHRQPLIFGALGGSLQHTLGNFSTLDGRTHLSPICFSEESQIVCLEAQTVHRLSNCPVGRSFGLFPLGHNCDRVTTQGFEWDMNGHSLAFGRFVSSSNRFVQAEATVEASHRLFLVVDGA